MTIEEKEIIKIMLNKNSSNRENINYVNQVIWFSIFCQIFYKHDIYELLNELPNDLRLRTLGK